MVAWQATLLFCADQGLIVPEEHGIDLKHVVVFVDDEVFDDDIEFATMGQGVSGTANEALSFFKVQFQS